MKRLGTEGIFDALMDFSAKDILSSEVKPKKLKPSEKLLKEIEAYGFDMSQLNTVLKTKGHQLIVSCAGSGKTTSIIFKIIYDLKTGNSTVVKSINGNNIRVPDKIWVATFLKSGADELKTAYIKWSNKLHCADMSQVIQFSTLHAEFKRALNLLGLQTDIISDSENRKLLRDVLRNLGIKGSRNGKLSEDELSTLIGALTRTRNRLDNMRYIADIYDEFGLVDTAIDCILREWKNARRVLGKVDFEDLQEILYDYCYVKKDESIINFLSSRFNYIYIDEFQDTSQIQYAVLRAYCVVAKQVVAIGDDDQTIYSWRGSDNKIITERFLNEFSPVHNNLSINFRCPSVILNAIAPSIKNNKSRFDKALRSHTSGGRVRVEAFSGYHKMAQTLSDLVYKDVQDGLSVAVLCRVNSDGLLPALFFDKMNSFSYSISGTGMTLDSYMGRLCRSILKLFTESFTADVERVLGLLTWDNYGVKKLMSVCKNNNVNIWNISEEDLHYSCEGIAERIISWRDFRKANGEISTLKLILQEYRYDVFTSNTQFNDAVKSILISIESLLDYYNYDTVEDFLIELDDIGERLKARQKLKRVPVRIATVHEFKGKEADSVYVWNDSEDVFPYKRSKDTTEDYEEERRVHYIACTRAKKISTIMYLRGRRGEFVGEMDLSNAEGLPKMTSGVLKSSIQEDAQLVKGLNEFAKSVVKE